MICPVIYRVYASFMIIDIPHFPNQLKFITNIDSRVISLSDALRRDVGILNENDRRPSLSVVDPIVYLTQTSKGLTLDTGRWHLDVNASNRR